MKAGICCFLVACAIALTMAPACPAQGDTKPAAAAAAMPGRNTAQAEWPEGKVVVLFGSPAWKDDFKGQMKDGMTWRLGSDMPTALTTTCGITAGDDVVPPGEYRLAVKMAGAKDWKLLVYRGQGFHQDGLQTWQIAPESVNDAATATDKLQIKLSDDKKLHVMFGPMTAVYALKPIKANAPMDTRFTNLECKIVTLAVPAEGGFKNRTIGCATAKANNGPTLVWDIRLTTNGDDATLTFTNPRAQSVTKEKESFEKMVAAMKERMGEASDEQKAMMEKRVNMVTEVIALMGKEEAALKRLQATRTFDGKAEARPNATSTLTCDHERVEGGLVLKLGAKDKTYVFDINPREFRAQ